MFLVVLLVVQCFFFAHIIFWFMFADFMNWQPETVVFIDVPFIFIISLIILLYVIYLSVIDYTTNKLEEKLKELKNR